MSRKQSYLFLLALAVNCVCAPARAADYLNMDLEQLLQVPVTGSTLSDESLKTVPAAVSVFTHEQLEKLGIDYLYELINLVPGYQFERGSESPTNYTFSARGRRNSGQAREVLVLVDGRMFAAPRTGSVDVFFPLIPLEQIERVEVIRGPGSALYGSSAFNGVINIITRTGLNTARVELGSDDRRSLSASLSGQTGDWVGNLNARAYEDSGQSFQVQDSFTKAPFNTLDPRQTFDLDAALKHAETQLRMAYHRTQGDDFFSVGNIQNGFNEGVYTLKQISVEQGLHWFGDVKTQVYFGYLKGEQELGIAVLGTGALASRSQPASNDPFLLKVELTGDSYNLRVTSDWDINDNASALFGLEWRREREVKAIARNNYDLRQLVLRDFPLSYYGDFSHSTLIGSYGTLESVGVYGQYLYDVSDATRLTLGLRYDNYEQVGDHLSPRLGLVHQLSDTQTVKLLYGEAYRAPSLGETGLINNPLLLGNPNLSYEIVKTWDLIWMLNWNNSSLSLGGFHNQYHDPIVASVIGTTRIPINGSDEQSNGMEFEMQQHLSESWSLRASYTDFFNLPQTAFREAKQLGSVELNFHQGQWNWNLLGYRQSERATPSVNSSYSKLDSFMVFNTKLRYRFQQGHHLSVQVKNLGDSAYATPAQNIGVTQGVPNRGREVSVVLGWAL